MAGEWIPMRTDLADDPAVIAIAGATGLDEMSVVGRLHRLWSWANKQLADGNARGVTPEWIDRYTATAGFAAAMLDAGWLRSRSGAVEFPNFDRWNSKGAKRRLLTAQRVKRSREADGNAPGVTGALPEERREENREKKPPLPPSEGGKQKPPASGPVTMPAELDTPVFRKAWAEWKAERQAQKRKPYTARGEQQQLAELAKFGPDVAAATITESTRNGYAGLFPKKATEPPRKPFLDKTTQTAVDSLKTLFTDRPNEQQPEQLGPRIVETIPDGGADG